MTKRYVFKEEWWPILELHDPASDFWCDEDEYTERLFDLPDELITRYEVAAEEFHVVQGLIREAIKPTQVRDL